MSSFLCKSILSRRNLAQNINPNAYHNTLRWLSYEPNKHSFTVSYFINSLGFSEIAALSASKQVSFKTKHKPDKVIDFLRDFGFTQNQISKLISVNPRLLVSNCESTILPKLEFLESKGISRTEIAKAISPFPGVLKRSLDRQIKPGYEFLRSICKSDDKAISAIRRYPNVLIDKSLRHNITVLQEYKVPLSNIVKLLCRHPNYLFPSSGRFRVAVDEVVTMGFDASKTNFFVAACARSLTKPNWDAKVDLYKKWGWSHQEFLDAFKREPNCMIASEDKISACMDFLTNQMGWASRSVVKYPLAVGMSLEKRVIPRCLVYQLLQSKGLVKKSYELSTLLSLTEEKFLKRLVANYKDKAPELSKIYEEKMKLSNGPSENDKLSLL